jgi:hypothetical protein
VTRGERREAAVAVVGYDRLELGQRQVLRVELRLEELSGRLDVVRLGRLDRDRERQAEDLDQDRALGPARVSAATAGLGEGRAGATALHGLGVDHHHRRVGLPVVAEPDLAGEDAHRRRPGAAVAPAPPLAPHRLPVGEPVGQVPPLAPGPRQPQDRVHDVPPRDRALDAPVDGRVEEVLDQPPLLVGQLDHRAHGRSLPAARDISKRDRVAALLRDAPPDRRRLLAHTTDQRQLAEQGVTEATAREQTARDRVAALGQGTGRLLHRRELAQARDHLALAHTAAQLARQQADRAADRQRQARRAQQQHLAYKERHAGLLTADRARARELAWRHRASLRALELERPGWLRELGQPPVSIKGQRAWRQAATHILQYRERYGITDPDHALGPEPRYADLEQRRHHRATRRVIERLRDRQRTQRDQQIGRRERAHPDQPRSRSSRTDGPAQLGSISVSAAAASAKPADQPPGQARERDHGQQQ